LRQLTVTTVGARLSDAQNLRETIHQANIAVHKVEASYYKLFHPEVYGPKEQKRLIAALKDADGLVSDNRKFALDFGAGTGNLTDKLLALGYTVTAVDISGAMCEALRRNHLAEIKSGKLMVVESPIEDLQFELGCFDLVTCCSVLHHLPDYEAALRTLCTYVKVGGVMFLDHEASPYFWNPEPSMLAQAVKSIYLHSNPILNSIYFRLIGLNIPTLDYTESDYWFKPEHHLEHKKIQSIFGQSRFRLFRRTDYFSRATWMANPLASLYRRICRPDMSCWVAKK
jgi:ubiquinone/menaquinone biosynthesis C-methylase UbiE